MMMRAPTLVRRLLYGSDVNPHIRPQIARREAERL
jgi:hypothetical protein